MYLELHHLQEILILVVGEPNLFPGPEDGVRDIGGDEDFNNNLKPSFEPKTAGWEAPSSGGGSAGGVGSSGGGLPSLGDSDPSGKGRGDGSSYRPLGSFASFAGGETYPNSQGGAGNFDSSYRSVGAQGNGDITGPSLGIYQPGGANDGDSNLQQKSNSIFQTASQRIQQFCSDYSCMR